jgi:hypothetical protein
MGQAAATQPIMNALTEFWRSQLSVTDYQFFGARYERACDTAYEELKRIAEWVAAGGEGAGDVSLKTDDSL